MCGSMVDIQSAATEIVCMYVYIFWAWVQPTLDPYAEGFIADPLR